MGIEIHGFNFLRLLAAKGEFRGRVITLGRQALDVPRAVVEQAVGRELSIPEFCEEALIALGAASVESIDISDYEGATHVADLSRPLRHHAQYDAVCDFGTLEHVFDVGTAFQNVIGLCRVGGSIVHHLPVNNLNGHGFWQFCSDLLYEVYSEKNGFRGTEIYYASGIDARYWYRAPLPKPGVCVEVCSLEPIILLCKTRKVREAAPLDVKQPAYALAWHREAGGIADAGARRGWPRLRTLLRRLVLPFPFLYVTARNCWTALGLVLGTSRYSVGGRQFERVLVREALDGARVLVEAA